MATPPTLLPGPMAGPGFRHLGAMDRSVNGAWCHAWRHTVGLET